MSWTRLEDGISVTTSELFEVQVPVDVLQAVVPEEHHFALRELLGPVEDQLDYIVEMTTEVRMT